MSDHRLFLAVWLLALLVGCNERGGQGEVSEDLRSRAAALHRESLVLDGHNDIASFWMIDDGFDLGMDGDEPGDRSPWVHWIFPWLPAPGAPERIATQTDLARVRRGGLDAQFFSVWVSPGHYDPEASGTGRSSARAHAILDVIHAQAGQHPDRLELAVSAEDVRRIAAEGKLAVLLGIEGGHAIESDLATLRDFYERGVRYMTLTWSFTHAWADSSGGSGQGDAEPRHGGLSEFGETVVREMNDLGMLVDVSHVSDEAFWDVIEVTRVPVIASHSSVRALAANPRNLSDDMLRAIAANGGVVMICFMAMMIDPDAVTSARFALDLLLHGGRSGASVADVVDHIDHVVRVAGVEHIGLGSDFDGSPERFFPAGLSDVGDFPNLTLELLRRGYTPEQIRLIMGENVLRVLSAAEQGAARE